MPASQWLESQVLEFPEHPARDGHGWHVFGEYGPVSTFINYAAFLLLWVTVVFRNNLIQIFHIISAVVRQIIARYSNFFTLFRPGLNIPFPGGFLCSRLA